MWLAVAALASATIAGNSFALGTLDLAESDAFSCVCPENYEPVCGVDKNTYSNSCKAKCAGVGVAYSGKCKTQLSHGSNVQNGDFGQAPNADLSSGGLPRTCIFDAELGYDIYFDSSGVCDGTVGAPVAERDCTAGQKGFKALVADPIDDKRGIFISGGASTRPDFCCKALTSTCLACVAGVSKQAFCNQCPGTVGCPVERATTVLFDIVPPQENELPTFKGAICLQRDYRPRNGVNVDGSDLVFVDEVRERTVGEQRRQQCLVDSTAVAVCKCARVCEPYGSCASCEEFQTKQQCTREALLSSLECTWTGTKCADNNPGSPDDATTALGVIAAVSATASIIV